MDVNKLFPFMYVDSVGIYGNIKDFNQATTSGYYKISGFDETVINKPLTGGYGDLVVHNANGYISQVYYGHYGNTLSVRTYDGKNWSDWVRTDNFGCNTLNELAAALKPELGL